MQNEDHFESVPVTNKNAEVYELYKRMKSISLQVRKNADTDFMYAKKFHDRNLHGPYFKAGDFCYVLIDCPSHKFAPRWRGPFVIKEAINDHIYRVTLQPGQDKIINISKLKHYKINRFSSVPNAGSSTLHTASEFSFTSQSPKPGASHNAEYDDDDQFVTLPYDTRDTHGTRTPPIPSSTPPSPAPIHQSHPTLSIPLTAGDDESPEIDRTLSAENLRDLFLDEIEDEIRSLGVEDSPIPSPRSSPVHNHTNLPSRSDARVLRSRSLIKSPVRYDGFVYSCETFV